MARLPPTDFFDPNYPPSLGPLPPSPKGTLRSKYPRARGVEALGEGHAETRPTGTRGAPFGTPHLRGAASFGGPSGALPQGAGVLPRGPPKGGPRGGDPPRRVLTAGRRCRGAPSPSGGGRSPAAAPGAGARGTRPFPSLRPQPPAPAGVGAGPEGEARRDATPAAFGRTHAPAGASGPPAGQDLLRVHPLVHPFHVMAPMLLTLRTSTVRFRVGSMTGEGRAFQARPTLPQGRGPQGRRHAPAGAGTGSRGCTVCLRARPVPGRGDPARVGGALGARGAAGLGGFGAPGALGLGRGYATKPGPKAKGPLGAASRGPEAGGPKAGGPKGTGRPVKAPLGVGKVLKVRKGRKGRRTLKVVGGTRLQAIPGLRLRRVRGRNAPARPTLLAARSATVARAALRARGMQPDKVARNLLLLKPKTPKGARAMVRAGYRIKRVNAKADAPAAKAAIRAATKARIRRAEAAATPAKVSPKARALGAARRATQVRLARRAAMAAALLKRIGPGPVTRARRARGLLSRQQLGAARGARLAARNAARALAAGAAHLGRRVVPRRPGAASRPATPLEAARAEANRTRAVLTQVEMVRHARAASGRPGGKGSGALAAARAEAQAAADAAEAKADALARAERVRAAKARLATPGARMLVEWEASGGRAGPRASMANEGVTKALTQAIRLKESAARGARGLPRRHRAGPRSLTGGDEAAGLVRRAGLTRVPKAPVIRLKHLKFKSHWELFPQVAEVQATAAAMAAPVDPRQAALTPAALAELLTPAEKAAWVAAQVRASGRPTPGLAPYPPTHGAGGAYHLAPGPAGEAAAREAVAALPWKGMPAAPQDAAEATAQGWVTEDHLADPELLRLWTETTAPDPYGVYSVLQDRRRALLTRMAPALGAAVTLGSTTLQREALAQLDARAKALATQMAKLKAGEDIALKDVGGTLPPSAWSAREASREGRKARLRAWHRLALAEKVRQDILAAGGTAPTESALLASLAADQAAVEAQGPDDPRLVKGKKAKAAAKARAKAAAAAEAEAAQRAARKASDAAAAAAALEVAAAAKALLLAKTAAAPGGPPATPAEGAATAAGAAGGPRGAPAGPPAGAPAGAPEETPAPGPEGPEAGAKAPAPAVEAPAAASPGSATDAASGGPDAGPEEAEANAAALAAAEALEADAAKALAAATAEAEAEAEDPLLAAVKKVRSARADDLFLTAEGAVRVGQTLVKGKATDVGLWDPMYKALTWNHWMAPRWTPIVPALVGVTLWVHNGRTWVPVVPTDLAVGRKVGEYVPTRWLPWPYEAREREIKGGKAARKAKKDEAKGIKKPKPAPKAKGKQPAPKPARRPVPVILNPDAFWVSQ